MGKKYVLSFPAITEKGNRKSLCGPGKRKHETENIVHTFFYAKYVFLAYIYSRPVHQC